jgi:hypothetical protein
MPGSRSEATIQNFITSVGCLLDCRPCAQHSQFFRYAARVVCLYSSINYSCMYASLVTCPSQVTFEVPMVYWSSAIRALTISFSKLIHHLSARQKHLMYHFVAHTFVCLSESLSSKPVAACTVTFVSLWFLIAIGRGNCQIASGIEMYLLRRVKMPT